MSHLFSLLKDRINFWLLLVILIPIALLTSTVVFDLSFILPQDTQTKIISLPQPKSTIYLLLLLLSMYLCYLLLFLSYAKKPRLKDFDHIISPGIMKHKKSGKYYCQPCLVKDHITCELSVINKDELFCHCCKSPYKIDHAILISDSVLSRAWDEAVKEHTSNNKWSNQKIEPHATGLIFALSLIMNSKTNKDSHWFLLFGDFIFVFATLLCLAPPIYALFLLHHSRALIGLSILFVWLVPYCFLLRLLHRRGIARFWLSSISTGIVLIAFGYVIWQF